MIVKVSPSVPCGTVKAIASKSVAHRLLICAAFADKKTVIRCEETNKDIEATAACLRALGVSITRNGELYEIEPISPDCVKKNATLPCGESGSTLRFLVPVVAALGADASFEMEGRLPVRPLSPLREELEAHGVTFSNVGSSPMRVSGRLEGSSFSIAGNVSSQFVSGLLFALTLLPHPATLAVTEKIESAPYLDITADALSHFGASPEKLGNVYKVTASRRLISPSQIDVEGDWSNAAFPLCLGVMGKGQVTVTGLNPSSFQGDAKIIELIKAFGGDVTTTADGKGYVTRTSRLHGISIDATQIPDLVPILATLASVAEGQTVIYGASRLRLKESDRLESVRATLSALGADVRETDDGLIINGCASLSGGSVSSFNDHRIAMSAAVAACVCTEDVIIDGAEATAKSYPSFWEDMKRLGVTASK